jgi:hypothetical protein
MCGSSAVFPGHSTSFVHLPYHAGRLSKYFLLRAPMLFHPRVCSTIPFTSNSASTHCSALTTSTRYSCLSVLEPNSATSSKFRELDEISAIVVNTCVSISSPSSHFSFPFQALPICRTDKILLLRRSVSYKYTAQSIFNCLC